jgi:ADP-dependent phosphofructokinase/glucokinase
VRFPRVEDGRVRLVPLGDAVNTDRTKTNWIFEFEDGAELFGVRAAADTRFIAASSPPEFEPSVDDLAPVVDRVGSAVDGALLAGYHTLTRETVDADYERVLEDARDVVRRLRSGGDLPVHVEYGVTHDDDLRRSLAEFVLPEADVIGLDAHELRLLGRDLGVEPTVGGDDAASRDPGDAEAAILERYRALTAVKDRLGVPCVRMHAMDYHLAVTDEYLPADAIRRGLEFAAVNAATKAATGRVTAPRDLERGLAYDPSDVGRGAVESLADHVGSSTDDGALCTPRVVAAPNRVVEDPAGTVGIGDVVSSASFALEVAVTHDRSEDGSE